MRFPTQAQHGSPDCSSAVLLIDANVDRRAQMMDLLEGCFADITVINICRAWGVE